MIITTATTQTCVGEIHTDTIETRGVEPFVMIPLWAMQAKVSGNAFRLFGLLLSKSSPKSPEPFPTNRWMAEYLGASVRSIQEWKAELVAAKMIEPIPVFVQNRQTSNRHVLHFTPHAEPRIPCETAHGGVSDSAYRYLDQDIKNVSSGEDTNNKPRARTSSGRRPPSEADAFDHAKQIGLPQSECELFLAHHDARDWTLKGGMAVKCWKSCMKTWKGNYDKRVFEGPSNPSKKPDAKPAPKECPEW